MDQEVVIANSGRITEIVIEDGSRPATGLRIPQVTVRRRIVDVSGPGRGFGVEISSGTADRGA